MNEQFDALRAEMTRVPLEGVPLRGVYAPAVLGSRVPARTALLEEATKITAQDRNKEYGAPEDNFQNIANYWNTYLTTIPKQGNIVPLTSQDVAHLMILMKMARLNTNPGHRDSLVDIAGYAACGEDCRVKRISEVNKIGR